MPFSANRPAEGAPARGTGLVRFAFESLVLLAAAVTIFRAFFAEGYMISTGSMAPTLLGYHKRVVCPHCRFAFERGAAHETSAHTASADVATLAGAGEPDEIAVCPICGTEVPVGSLPRTEGDQLLVHKHHYAFRDPRRWEVVVFHNPSRPTEAYVKRVVGLPGESIEIVDGDVYADGLLQRKPLEVQLSSRLPVDDVDRAATAPDAGGDRWFASMAASGWGVHEGRFVFRDRAAAGADAVATDTPTVRWMEYHHLRTNSGARPMEAAIIDLCSYNAPESTRPSSSVNDLMLELQVTPADAHGNFVAAIHDGRHEFQCTLDFDAKIGRLTADGKSKVHRECPLPAALTPGATCTLTLSTFDRQIIAAIDRQPLFESLLYAEDGPRLPLPPSPVRFGAIGGAFDVAHVRLYRDVYYTSEDDQPSRDWALGDDEFFVLGDNSPVSLDSRTWEDPAVKRSMLIGRPFVVHLPSEQCRLSWGGREGFVRVPDLSRVRYIH